MLRPLFVMLTVGVVGMAAASLIFSLVIPIVILALKIGMFVIVGYFILRLVKPEMADNLRNKVKGKSAS